MPIRIALLPHFSEIKLFCFLLLGFYLENFQMIENHLKIFLEPLNLSYKEYLVKHDSGASPMAEEINTFQLPSPFSS